VADHVSSIWALIGVRLAQLQALLTDEAVDVVTERYLAWKKATHAALEGFVEASDLEKFERAGGQDDPASGRRPTPPVYLDGAASRTFLTALRKELEAEIPVRELGTLKILELLERRLGKAFRGRPETVRDVQDGFETLLAGAGIAYERNLGPVVGAISTCVPDFTFKDLQTALVLKMCQGLSPEEELIAEIKDQILACRSRYTPLVIGVCDFGFISEKERFCRTLEHHDGVVVRVIMLSPGNLATDAA